jgi:hypothetical protein
VSFSAVDAFVRLAEGANVLLHILYKVVNDSLLMVPSMETSRADLAHFSQRPIQSSGVSSAHFALPLPE